MSGRGWLARWFASAVEWVYARRGGIRHCYCRKDCARFGIHQRAVYRFLEAGKPDAHAGGTEKGEGGVWARIPDVAERTPDNHNGKAHVDEPFASHGNYRCFPECRGGHGQKSRDRKSTRLNSSHSQISYAVFCL